MIKPVPAPAPFDNPDADVILRSSDKEPVDFRTFKLLLSLSSSFFSEILTLPQPASDAFESPSLYTDEFIDASDAPVIQMAEDAQTLRLLLGFCQPISVAPLPRISSLHDMHKAIEAACKFEMEGVLTYLRGEIILPRFMEAQPLRVFAIAYRYGWDAEARKAARYTLRHPIDVAMAFVPELEFISGATLCRLQEYHRICGEVASSRALIQPALAEYTDSWTWISCMKCPAAWTPSHCVVTRRWWADWIKDVAEELRVKPWGESVRKWDALERALTSAASCSNCSHRSREDLEAFSLMLSVAVDKEIAAVKISCPSTVGCLS